MHINRYASVQNEKPFMRNLALKEDGLALCIFTDVAMGAYVFELGGGEFVHKRTVVLVQVLGQLMVIVHLVEFELTSGWWWGGIIHCFCRMFCCSMSLSPIIVVVCQADQPIKSERRN